MRANRAALTTLVAALMSPSPLGASLMVPHTIESLTESAQHVVQGRVSGSYCAWDDDHRRILTFTEIEVDEHVSLDEGSAQEDAVLVRTLGGVIGPVGMRVSGVPHFEVGQEVLLFLRTGSGGSRDAMRLVGLGQGAWKVDRTGATVMVRPMTEGIAFASSGSGPQAVELAELRAKVRAAAASGSGPESPRTQ
ncbi:MAG: hypothetical protein ACFB9M_13945 [Myxococcota bacterium]